MVNEPQQQQPQQTASLVSANNAQPGVAPPRSVPISELDFQYRTTDPTWGRFDVPPELRERLSQMVQVRDNDGNVTAQMDSMWGLLGYYTRDLRLANLSEWNNEMQYCIYYLDLSGDLLREEYPESFMAALPRLITVMELSQSKGGFFRKLLNTFRSEQSIETIEPKKSALSWGRQQR